MGVYIFQQCMHWYHHTNFCFDPIVESGSYRDQRLHAATVESCTERGSVRLVGTVNMTEGRLEICLDGYWGTVCNDGFDNNSAVVVCRQLGFHDGEWYIS